MSLYQAYYGRLPPTIPYYIPHSTPIHAFDEILQEKTELFGRLKETLNHARNCMAEKANKRRREVKYSVGDFVLLKLQPYRQKSMAKRLSHKLSKRYFGPFEILRRIGVVAYKLKLPPDSLILPIFQVSLLKPFKGDNPMAVTTLPPSFSEPVDDSPPFSVCSLQQILRNGKMESEALVLWNGHDPVDAQWVLVAVLETEFLGLHLEDNVHVNGEGSDTT